MEEKSGKQKRKLRVQIKKIIMIRRKSLQEGEKNLGRQIDQHKMKRLKRNAGKLVTNRKKNQRGLRKRVGEEKV